MNCQDISRLADKGRLHALTPAERQAVEAHVASCSRCAAVWSAHVRLMALDVPPMPAEVALHLQALAATPVRAQGRYPLRRLTLIGGLVVLAAAAGVLIWGLGGHSPRDSRPAAAGVTLPADAATSRSVAAAATSGPARPAASTLDPGNEAAMCAQTLRDVEAFAVMERNAAYPDLAEDAPVRERSDDEMLADLRGLQRRLAASPDAETFLAAMLLYSPERRALEDPAARRMLAELGTRAGESRAPLLAWHALRACVEADQSCPYAHLVQGLVEADRQNAEAWALLALFKYRRGDLAGALAAMQGAALAPASTWYWAESNNVIERALAAGTAMSHAERMDHAFGSTAAALPPVAVYTMCRTESARGRAWAEACLDFGTLRARSDTTAARGMAYAIREQALLALGDTERAAEVAGEYALFDAERIGGNLAPVGNLPMVLIQADPAQVRAYLDAMQQYGEDRGVRMFLRQQLPALLERAGLHEREGARECVAQLFEPRTAIGTRAATIGRQIQVADQLLVSARGGRTLSTVVQVRPDGTFMLPLAATGRMGSPQSEVMALGKTPEQLQREIATLLARRNQPPTVLVIPVIRRSREDLRREFDAAWRETAQRRQKLR